MSVEAILILATFAALWFAGYITTSLSVSWENVPPWKKPIAALVLIFLWPWLAIEIVRRLP